MYTVLIVWKSLPEEVLTTVAMFKRHLDRNLKKETDLKQANGISPDEQKGCHGCGGPNAPFLCCATWGMLRGVVIEDRE